MMFSTEYVRIVIEERERQVTDHLRVRNLVRPHRVEGQPPKGREAHRGRERR